MRTLEEMNTGLAELQVETGMQGSRFRLYFQEGEQTADGRVIDPNATNFNRPPPLPLRIQLQSAESGGHAGAIICGVIDTLARDGTVIIAEGRIDLGSPAGVEAERLIREGIMATWSPDLGDATVDIEENYLDEDGSTPQEVLAHFVKATLLGGTLVAMPALASAVVELLNEDGVVLVAAPQRKGPEAEAVGVSTDPNDNKAIVERVAASGGGSAGGGVTIIGDSGRELFIPATNGTVTVNGGWTTSINANLPNIPDISNVSACAGPSAPPSAYFSNPNLPSPQRFITVTAEGRVFGHLACFGECHIGYRDVCIEPPRGGSYSYFHVGQVRTLEDTLIATGPLTLRGGHASRSSTASQAQAHYDDTDSAVADVVLGEDEFGIWFSGSLRPTITDSQLRTFRASGVSADWRKIGDALELIGACSVNTPGFPKVRLVASGEDSSGEIVALVAAGGAPLPAIDIVVNDATEDNSELAAKVDRLLSLVENSSLMDEAFAKLEEDFPS